MELKRKEKQILVEIQKRGIVKKEILELHFNSSLIDSLIDREILDSDEYDGITVLIVNSEYSLIAQKLCEKELYQWTRGKKELDILMKRCLEDKPGVPF